ncbi:MAG: hypothetical protein HYU58_09825 [Proteobacteria bacterium]|nr:hypothetical protein [Pseudomonadota bacterium]
MRHFLAATMAALTLPLAVGLAQADPVAEGATKTLNFTISVKEQTKSQWSSTAIARVLKAQCVMVAGPATQVSWSGPTPEQQAALDQSQANAAAFQQNYAPSDQMMGNMQAMMDKCGEDEACIQAEVMKMSQTPEVQAMVGKQEQAKKDVAGLTPDLGPARYQVWAAQSCSGTLAVNDSYFTSDPGGEGGYGAFQDTTTAQGEQPIDPQAIHVTAQTDSVGKTTSYRLAAPVEATFASVSQKDGAGQRKIQLLSETALPPEIGPLKGVLGTQKSTISGENGSVIVSFSK